MPDEPREIHPMTFFDGRFPLPENVKDFTPKAGAVPSQVTPDEEPMKGDGDEIETKPEALTVPKKIGDKKVETVDPIPSFEDLKSESDLPSAQPKR